MYVSNYVFKYVPRHRKSLSFTCWGLAAICSLVACKETNRVFENAEDAAEDRDAVVVARRSPEPEFYAADTAFIKKNADFFFRVWDESFTRRFDDLPKSGEVSEDKRPRPGGYYAEQNGGTNVALVGGKSPLAKFDDAFNGGQSLAVQWERTRHSHRDVSWAGHCNGYSAAAQRHPQEPQKSVTRNGITFAPQDIKALLAEIYMSADWEFLGGQRCDTSGSVPLPGSRADPTVMSGCEDTNPGTFHVAVGNWIGRMQQTLIMDESANDQVWNYPVFKYEVLQATPVSAEQARRLVGGSGGYIFNPGAAKFVQVRTRTTFPKALPQEVLQATTRPAVYATYWEQQTLDYVLELNAAGEILGGEWIGASQQNHPDFIWIAFAPLPANGTRYMGNPHVDPNEVIRLWAESIGGDPDNPPRAISRPAADNAWGRFASFDVTLDGGVSGAVFAGKSTTMRLKRRNEFAGDDVTVDLTLNGKSLTTLSGDADADLHYTFDAPLGWNSLRLTWKRANEVLEGQPSALPFRVIR